MPARLRPFVVLPQARRPAALLADEPAVYFTTPHFDGYPAVLVRLDVIARDDLDELVVEAWLARAPKRLAKAWEQGLDVGGETTDGTITRKDAFRKSID